MTVESRKENFKRVASRRTENVLSAIRSLKMCSNRRNYYYTEKEVNKIFRAINEELKQARILFVKNKTNKFEL